MDYTSQLQQLTDLAQTGLWALLAVGTVGLFALGIRTAESLT